MNGSDGAEQQVEILIVGSGFAGLGMAVKLFEAGWRDVVIVERADEVGGTWRDNTYPGAACDVPSHLYSFSFAPNPRWSRSFSGQREILAYLRAVADRFGIRPWIRFGCEVLAADWDDDARRWLVRTTAGSFSARFLIAGTGPLAEPSMPDVPGLADFEGPVWHSARWDHDEALEGRRVAVVGTGASAAQFLPEVVARAERVVLFQRTPPWVMPRRDRLLRPWEHRLFARARALQLAVRAGIYWGREVFFLGFGGAWVRRLLPKAEELARRHLVDQVADPELRARLTPDYAFGCKRIVLSNDYYPAVTQNSVDLVDGALSRVTPHGVVGPDGVEHAVDVIIFATGFHATDPPVGRLVRGRDGVALEDRWAEGMAAYKGTTVARYPNLFLLVGPNTGLGHNSIVYIIESQTAYIAECLGHLRASGLDVVEVDADAQRRWNAEVQQRMAKTVWSTGGCDSWYLDRNGRNTTLWPGFSFQYRAAVRHFDPAAYHIGRQQRPNRPPVPTLS